MNRSQRRAAVIKGSIAAALLCSGTAMAATAPAVADVGGYDDSPDVSNHAAVGRPGRGGIDDQRTGYPQHPRRGPQTPADSDNPEWHPRPDWPCRILWPAIPFVSPLPYTGNRNGIIFQGGGMQAPISVLSGVADTGEHASTGVDSPAAEAAPAASPALVDPPGVEAVSPAIPELPPPAAPPPLPQQPESVAAPVDSDRTELPNRLPQTNLGRIAATALPGLAGIAALTALGGFLGYRQAKAGYVLRAAGTARFLR